MNIERMQTKLARLRIEHKKQNLFYKKAVAEGKQFKDVKPLYQLAKSTLTKIIALEVQSLKDLNTQSVRFNREYIKAAADYDRAYV